MDRAAVAIIGRNSSPGSCLSSGTRFKMSSAILMNECTRCLENVTLTLATVVG